MKLILTLILNIILTSCIGINIDNSPLNIKKNSNTNINYADMDTITLGAGCFWCVEAIFQNIKGVESVISGYANGKVKNPSYKEVSSGKTGHAEVCQLIYDPKIVSFTKILEIFWQTHDPTTLNKQGGDIGTQYRSGIYYHTEKQKVIAEDIYNQLDDAGVFGKPIVTEITEIKTFYAAENYHQDYFELNGDKQYCRIVIIPKLEKFKKIYSEILK